MIACGSSQNDEAGAAVDIPVATAAAPEAVDGEPAALFVEALQNAVTNQNHGEMQAHMSGPIGVGGYSIGDCWVTADPALTTLEAAS